MEKSIVFEKNYFLIGECERKSVSPLYCIILHYILTKSERGEEVEGRPKSKFRPFVETKDDNGNPIRFGEKFKENPSRNDLSPAAVAKIKKLTFRYAGNAAENRKKVREIKKRK